MLKVYFFLTLTVVQVHICSLPPLGCLGLSFCLSIMYARSLKKFSGEISDSECITYNPQIFTICSCELFGLNILFRRNVLGAAYNATMPSPCGLFYILPQVSNTEIGEELLPFREVMVEALSNFSTKHQLILNIKS